MAVLPNLVNADLKRGLPIPQVAEKHACPACPVALADGTGVGPEDRTGGGTEVMVWSVALEGKDDLERFKALKWGIRTWGLWNWNDCDRRFGDDWPARHRERSGEAPPSRDKLGGPGRIPTQLVGHVLY